MSYATEARQFEQQLMQNATDRTVDVTGFTENFIMGVGQVVDENLTISEDIVRASGGWDYESRNKKLRALRKQGAINDEDWIAFTRPHGRVYNITDYKGLAEYVSENIDTTIRTNEELDEQMREGLAQRKLKAEDVFARQSTLGAIGEFSGATVGYGLEPLGMGAIIAEPILIGRSAYALSQATTRMGRGLIAARSSVVTNVVAETAMQPAIFNWKEKIGVDMTWVDALENVASVAILSGVISGAASSLRTKTQFDNEQLAARAMNGTLTTKDLSSVLKQFRETVKETVKDTESEDLLKQTEFGLDGSNPATTAKEHFEEIDAAEARFNDDPVESADIEEVDIVIDDAQLEADFNDRIKESLYMKDLALSDLDDLDPQAGMFGFDEVKVAGKEDVSNAIKQINNADKKSKQLATCLLGGAP